MNNSIVASFKDARESSASFRMGNPEGGIELGLQAATMRFLELFGRQPEVGEVEEICGVPPRPAP